MERNVAEERRFRPPNNCFAGIIEEIGKLICISVSFPRISIQS
jgi:hypothetical protein